MEEELEHLIEQDPDSPLIEDIYERMEKMDPDTFESRASSILVGLGFDQVMIKKKTKDMSGGWRMR